MKKILLVGDFRDCANYGAVGTTEMLMKMLESSVGKDNVKSIYHRSFNIATPIDGWKETSCEYRIRRTREVLYPSMKQRLLDKYDRKFSLKMYRYLKKELRVLRGKNDGFEVEKFHVPYKFSEFDSFSEEVMNDKRLQYEKNMIEWADVVLINAEGSLVKGTDKNGYYHVSGLYPLYIAYLSKKYLKKECYIINHTVDPQNRDILHMISNIYPMMDSIYLREPKSQKILDECGVSNYEYIPDALFAFEEVEDWSPSEYICEQIDFTKPYICLGDSSGFYTDRENIWDVEKTYCEIIKKLRNICPQIIFIVGFGVNYPPIMNAISKMNVPYVSVHNTNYVDLYHILKNGKIFISGRWHTSILSLLAKTPILLFGSDSHKTEALYEMVGYQYRFFDVRTLPINVDELVAEANAIMEANNDEYFNKAKELGVLARNNVKMLKKTREVNNES